MDRSERSYKSRTSKDFRRKQGRLKARLKTEFTQVLQLGQTLISPQKSDELLKRIHVGIIGKEIIRKPVRSLAWIKWAAAAMLLLLAGGVWRHYYVVPASPVVVAVHADKKDQVIIESNTEDEVRSIILSDKSVVKLSKGSSVSYYASFNKIKRDISLSGQAVFEVARDISKPFTVYAEDISTTVLGTRFMMNTQEHNKVHVKLFEGKVLIRSVSRTFPMQDIYLHPGQQFVIDKELRHFSVMSFKDNKSGSADNTISEGLEFNQEPLPEVLARIGKHYQVRFVCKGEHFGSMLVTGKLLPSDSLQVVLSMLGSMNNLSFKERNNIIEVTRIQ